ncbi:hypothetical protein ACQ86B_09510 [Mycolicibacterium aichiense]|uniref:hypothetical protein n=1 Tax=Mycolicibacterium aichiense TaxID=1799 RepID=UPI003D67021E
MTETGNQTTVDSSDLTDELRESAKAGQHAAGQALRKFRDAVDDAIPESVQPLRDKIVQAALDLADDLVSAQYKFHRSLLNTADRALTKSDADR